MEILSTEGSRTDFTVYSAVGLKVTPKIAAARIVARPETRPGTFKDIYLSQSPDTKLRTHHLALGYWTAILVFVFHQLKISSVISSAPFVLSNPYI